MSGKRTAAAKRRGKGLYRMPVSAACVSCIPHMLHSFPVLIMRILQADEGCIPDQCSHRAGVIQAHTWLLVGSDVP